MLDAALVQGSAQMAEGRRSTPHKKSPQEHRLRKTLVQRSRRAKQAQFARG
jgi:hypothetical protein